MNIETKVKKAQKKIAEGYAALRSAQEECTHPNLQGKYGSNTGNWCPTDDRYWVDLFCPCCGKRWAVDGEKDDYRHYGNQKWQKYPCEIVKEWKV